ncbi:MAG: hypothetical protein NTW30_03655 [Candidatus Aenigmarchaeota archaeon]|nr:hypothetical protein [Candidatus Aenigmarchaeota archaeon]
MTNENYRLENINKSILLPNDTHINHDPTNSLDNNKKADAFLLDSLRNTSLDTKEITYNEMRKVYLDDKIPQYVKTNLLQIEWRYSNCKKFARIPYCKSCREFIESKRFITYCYLPFCPDCNKKVFGRFFYRVKHLLELHNRNLKFVTLTADLEPNKQNVDFLRDKFHKLRKKLHWENTIYCFESGSQGKKLHIHAIIYGLYVEQSKISKTWESLTSFPIVFIQKVSNSKKAISYIASYISKHTPLFLAEVYRKRKLSTTGIFYRIKYDIEITLPKFVCQNCGSTSIGWFTTENNPFGVGYP